MIHNFWKEKKKRI